MARGKTITLYLMDGDVSGPIKCKITNWTGVTYKIPRTALDLDICKACKHLKQSGVYFLMGISDQTEQPVAYIGQAGARKNGEGILNRLQEHKRNPEKDYWTEAIVFTTSDDTFGPTEISYLENRFCNLAVDANRYEVKNGNDPTSGNITEEKESELEDFIDYAKLVMGVLGHKVFVPLTKPVAEPEHSSVGTAERSETELYLKRNIKKYSMTVKAAAKQTSDGLVVLKGSIISPFDDHTISSGIKKKRSNAKVDENHILLEDVLFSSPSSAAEFVIGQSTNGWLAWRTEDDRTLRNLEENK